MAKKKKEEEPVEDLAPANLPDADDVTGGEPGSDVPKEPEEEAPEEEPEEEGTVLDEEPAAPVSTPEVGIPIGSLRDRQRIFHNDRLMLVSHQDPVTLEVTIIDIGPGGNLAQKVLAPDTMVTLAPEEE